MTRQRRSPKVYDTFSSGPRHPIVRAAGRGDDRSGVRASAKWDARCGPSTAPTGDGTARFSRARLGRGRAGHGFARTSCERPAEMTCGGRLPAIWKAPDEEIKLRPLESAPENARAEPACISSAGRGHPRRKRLTVRKHASAIRARGRSEGPGKRLLLATPSFSMRCPTSVPDIAQSSAVSGVLEAPVEDATSSR